MTNGFRKSEVFRVEKNYIIGEQELTTFVHTLHFWHCYSEGADCVSQPTVPLLYKITTNIVKKSCPLVNIFKHKLYIQMRILILH